MSNRDKKQDEEKKLEINYYIDTILGLFLYFCWELFSNALLRLPSTLISYDLLRSLLSAVDFALYFYIFSTIFIKIRINRKFIIVSSIILIIFYIYIII